MEERRDARTGDLYLAIGENLIDKIIGKTDLIKETWELLPEYHQRLMHNLKEIFGKVITNGSAFLADDTIHILLRLSGYEHLIQIKNYGDPYSDDEHMTFFCIQGALTEEPA